MNCFSVLTQSRLHKSAHHYILFRVKKLKNIKFNVLKCIFSNKIQFYSFPLLCVKLLTELLKISATFQLTDSFCPLLVVWSFNQKWHIYLLIVQKKKMNNLSIILNTIILKNIPPPINCISWIKITLIYNNTYPTEINSFPLNLKHPFCLW